MASGGTNLASGTRVSLRYQREAIRNTTPAGIGSPAVNIAAAVGAAGFADFTRTSGSFITDGFFKGQLVQTAGFAASNNNGNFVVDTVTALTLTVVDAGDAVTNETAATGQSVRILLETLRATGRNVNLEQDLLESEEVDPDGMETDVRLGFNRVVGAPGFQLGLVDYDDFLEFATGGTFETVTVTGSPDLGVSSSTFTRATGSFITDGFRAGDRIRTTGFTNTANNGDFTVTAVAATVLTVSDPNGLLVDEGEAGSKTLLLPGRRIDVQNVLCTILLERAFEDVLQFQLFNGVAVDQFALNVEPEAIINGTLNLLGMSAQALAASSVSGVDPAAATGNSPFAAFDGAIFEGTSEIAVATSLDFTLTRGRSLNPVIGSKFSPDVFEGTARLNGTLTAFFEDAVLYNKFVNETESMLYFRFDDPNSATDFHNIVIPRVKYVGATLDPPQEGPVPLEMPFRGLKATGLAVPGGTTRNTLLSIQVSNAA